MERAEPRRGASGKSPQEEQAQAPSREAKLAAIFNAPSVGIVVSEGGEPFSEVNDAFLAMHGYAREELLGKTWRDLTHPDDLARDEDLVARMVAGEFDTRSWDKRHLRKDGSAFWVHLSLSCTRDPDGRPRIGVAIIQDIDEQRRAKEALLESEERFRTLASAAPVGIFLCDPEANNTFVNPAFLRLTGLAPAEALGRGWTAAVHPDDRDRVLRESSEALGSGGDFITRFRFVVRDGRVVTVRTYASPMRNGSGAVTGYVGVVADVTDELAVQQKLAVASRFAALGTLVAGVGHEINNPLAAAMANDGAAVADLANLERDLRHGGALDAARISAAVAEIRESAEGALAADRRIAQIVKDLVVLGRADAPRSRVVLRAVVDATLRWLPPHVRGSARVEIDDRDAPDVNGHPGQLSQVLVNLISNAARAAPPGRPSRVVVRLEPGGPGMSRIQVVDDGVGIPPENLERLFDPFFSTRETGEGMGLGLPVSYAIVREMGGTLAVASEVGKGSTFTIELPVAVLPGAVFR